MSVPPLLDGLIEALRCMPGIGRKSAQRIAYHLLQRDRDGARKLAGDLIQAMDRIGYCGRCRTFSETSICQLCNSQSRDRTLLCVVESPADVYAVEEAGYRGLYFVLMGHLSPLDGIGPEDLGLEQLEALLAQSETKEVILATNPTTEGDLTALYLKKKLEPCKIKVTRIGRGMATGGDIEYADELTLVSSLTNRKELV